MWLSISNTYTKVERATDEERAWLREYLSFEDSTAYFRGAKDDRVRLYSLVTSTFPTGFLHMVQKAGAAEGFRVETLSDSRVIPCQEDTSVDLSWLRDYQRTASDRAVTEVRGVLKLPTGAGKTWVAIATVMRLPCPWLFLVHKKSLMDQTAEVYEERTGRPAGRIGDGEWSPQPRFTVATFQTLHARLKQEAFMRVEGPAKQLLKAAGGLFVDEAHTLAAASFAQVGNSCHAYWRIGLSATPFARGDRRSPVAVGVLGGLLYEVKPQVLQAAGVIAVPRIRFVEVRQEGTPGQTLQGVKGELINRSTVRNQAIVRIAQKAEKPCLIFVEQLAHGDELEKRLGKAGLNAAFVEGAASVQARKLSAQRLTRGDLDVVVSTVVWQEGIDIPALRSVVIAGGGKSVIAALQRIGRGMRVVPGKNTFTVWEIDDKGQKWLERHARARKRAYLAEGHTVTEEQV